MEGVSGIFEALAGEYEVLPDSRYKLSEGDVRDIRAMYASGAWKQAEIAEQYKVTQPQISKIVNNKRWKAK